MTGYIMRRLGYSLISLLLLSLTIFLFVRVTGDPTTLLVEPGASQADIDAIRQRFGLDRPIWVQYWNFMASLVQGDFGNSFYYRTPVLELYLSRLPNSLLLALAAMAFSLLIGIPSGILAAVRVGGFWDSAGKVFSLLGLSLPSFWVGLVLILIFSVSLGWLPSSGSGTVWHLLMPAFALGWYFAAAHMRLTRSSPGIGRLLYEGITFRDFPVVQAVVLLGGGMIVLVNLLIDILYAVIDPRIRLEK